MVATSVKVTLPYCWSGLLIGVSMSDWVRHKQCQVATAMMLCRFFGVAVLAMLNGSPHLVAIVCSSSFLNFLSLTTWSILLTWESNCFCLLTLRSLRRAATHALVLLMLLGRLSDNTSVGSLRTEDVGFTLAWIGCLPFLGCRCLHWKRLIMTFNICILVRA